MHAWSRFCCSWLAAWLFIGAPASASHASELIGGETSLRFHPRILDDLGIETTQLESTADATRHGGAGFAMRMADAFSTRGGRADFEGFDALDVAHEGGFVWRIGDESISFLGFRLRHGARPDEVQIHDAAGRAWLRVRLMYAVHEDGGNTLRLRNADVVLGDEISRRLGRPDLEGSFVGVLDADLHLAPQPRARSAPRGVGGCSPDFGQPADVALIGLDGLSQAAREAGGRVAMAPTATLTNLGPGDVMWNKAIAPDSPVGPHPFLSLHFYRLSDGVLEQLGRGDVKHAFHAQNANCGCPGGSVLFAGCDDVYTTTTNLNRHHLAPRPEVNAFTRTWTGLGSHFDATPVDDFRDHDDAPGDHDDFDHRLVVQEPDLQTAGARYFIEAWYLAAGDTNLLNSLGHREVAPTFGGSTWTFPIVDTGLMSGSILDAWIDPNAPDSASELVDTGEGRLQVAVKVTDLGGGSWHYEYALMNFDFDRQVNVFALPTLPSIQVTNVGFGDGNADPNDDWTIDVGPHRITWTAPPGGSLDWGALANFRFDADEAPVASQVALTPLEGSGPAIRASTLAATGFLVPVLPGGFLALVAGLALGAVLAAQLLRSRTRCWTNTPAATRTDSRSTT